MAMAEALAPLAALAADAAGPLPDYHPACLRAVLLLGRPDVASAALRALLQALVDAKQASAAQRQEVVRVGGPSCLRLPGLLVVEAPQASSHATLASTDVSQTTRPWPRSPCVS